MKASFGIALLVAFLVLTTGAWAGTVSVSDNDFETPVCGTAGSGTTCGSVPAWTLSGTAGQVAYSAAQYGSDGTNQVGFASNGGELSQVVSSVMDANETYVLSVLVGARTSSSNPFGGEIELWAGSTMLGIADIANSTAPTAGNWTTWTVTVDSANYASLANNVNDPLEIALLTPSGSVAQTGFDNVSLTENRDGGGVAPEPAMFALVGAGLLGLVTRRRFAK
ncbi:MAG: PEP-CTERM sorting domain-containing protein [Bryobacteraceae bacterium]